MTIDPAGAAGSWQYKGQTYYFCHVSCLARFKEAPEQFLAPGQPAAPATAVDPVCGMTIDPASAAGQFDHHGQTYYFCHPSCLARFKEAPEKYLTSATAPASPAPTGTRYICPMDPEVEQDHPGTCPEMRHGAGAGRSGGTDPCRVHVPDASGDRPRRARRVSDLRHGARAAHGRRPRRSQPGTGRHDAGGCGSACCSGCRCSSSRWGTWSSAWAWAARSTCGWPAGSVWCVPRRSCSGPAGRSSSAAGPRS